MKYIKMVKTVTLNIPDLKFVENSEHECVIIHDFLDKCDGCCDRCIYSLENITLLVKGRLNETFR